MANELADEFDVEREWIPGLVKLTLYDFIIFCGRFLPRRDLILQFWYEFGLRLMQITALLCQVRVAWTHSRILCREWPKLPIV